MKPLLDRLHVVTATVDPLRAVDCFASWLGKSRYHLPVHTVWSTLGRNFDDRLTGASPERDALMAVFAPGAVCHVFDGGGVVPAFAYGVEAAYKAGAEMVLCLHDDVLIEEEAWDAKLCGLVDELYGPEAPAFGGFGGATQLGAQNLYQVPYDPMQLARGGFVSNMRDAEAHGQRLTTPARMVCFDGFSQFGRGAWFRQAWRWLGQSGVNHHFYDGMLGCLAARAGVTGYLLPIACHHYGGRTAVASEAYHAWTTAKGTSDQTFWNEAHRIGYDTFKDVLPLRVK